MIQPILQEELFNLSDTPAGGRRDHLISKKKKKKCKIRNQNMIASYEAGVTKKLRRTIGIHNKVIEAFTAVVICYQQYLSI